MVLQFQLAFYWKTSSVCSLVFEQCIRWVANMLDRNIHQSLFCSDQKLQEPKQWRSGGVDIKRLQKESSNTAKSWKKSTHGKVPGRRKRIPVLYWPDPQCAGRCDQGQRLSWKIAILIPSRGWGMNLTLWIMFIHNTELETPLQIIFLSCCVVKARGFWMDWEPGSGLDKSWSGVWAAIKGQVCKRSWQVMKGDCQVMQSWKANK